MRWTLGSVVHGAATEPLRSSLLLRVTVALMVCGLVVLASASHTQGSGVVLRQAAWMLLGVVGAIGIRQVSYQRWLDAAPLFYALALICLLCALAAGRLSHGATRWVALGPLSFQPAELGKLATVLCLARVLGDVVAGGAPLTGRAMLTAAVIGGVPMLLVFLQPDLGSASVFLWITLVMLWLAGLPVRYVLGGLLLAGALAPAGWHMLKDYQRARLLVFLDPHADPLGAGYTLIQSRIAIGSGGLWGKGWMAGTQNQLNFLPERHTDFIFSIVGEEWGFLGSVVLIGLFGWWLMRAWWVAGQIREAQGRLIIGGLAAWLGYHVVVNIGMTMGLLPVVGIPLPLISYGGSAVLITLMAVGIIESIHRWSPRF